MKEDNKITFDKIYITAAKEAVEQFDYGDVIPKRWLLNQFALEEPKTGTRKDFEDFAFEYLQNIEGFREEMLVNYQMYLVNIRGKGYMIAHPNQQTDLAMTRLKERVSSELIKARDTLTYVNANLLTDEEVKKRDEAQGKIAAIAAFHQVKRIGKA